MDYGFRLAFYFTLFSILPQNIGDDITRASEVISYGYISVNTIYGIRAYIHVPSLGSAHGMPLLPCASISNTIKGGAISKGFASYTCHTIGNRYARKRFTIPERARADARYSILKRYFCNGSATIECIQGNI